MILLTGYDDNMAEIGELTSARMRVYAERHGLGFECVRDYHDRTHPSWQKAGHIIKVMEDSLFDRVLWLDADTVITNMDTPPPTHQLGLHVSRDWGSDSTEPNSFSLGNFLACVDSVRLWADLDFHEFIWGNKPLWEQSCIRQLWEDNEWVRNLIKVHPRRVFNAVPGDMVGPEDISEVMEPWEPGDWLCHLTWMPNEERVRRFHELV